MKRSIGAKTILYPTPVLCVGTYDKDGRPNVMTAAWGGICCSKPVCVAVSLRKATYTYASLMERKAFTISIPSERYLKEADYFGIASGRDADKFKATGLTPQKAEHVDAPYVEEFPMVLECRVAHVLEIGLHTQFVGEVLDIKVEDDCLADKDMPDIQKVRPFLFAPDSGLYYGVGSQAGKAFSDGRPLLKAAKE